MEKWLQARVLRWYTQYQPPTASHIVLGVYQSPPDNFTDIYVDVWSPLLRPKNATLDVNTTDSAGTLLELFGQAKNDYLCESM